MSIKYSIVITAYNAEKYINKCLESVMRQTYKKWELILVNDGSTDLTKDICQSFADKINNDKNPDRCVIFISQENMGAVHSRERGICSASGEYLLFMDADDWWDDNLIETIDQAVYETNADIIQFGYKFWDENGKEAVDAGLIKKGCLNSEKKHTVINENNIFSYKALTICYSLWSRAIKRTLFDKEEGFYAPYYDVNMTNDLLALSRPLSLADTFCFIEAYPYNYRIVGSSLCHNVSINKICAYFRSLGWAEKCMRERNGQTEEHNSFFSNRLINIVFDEYRENIYKSSIRFIKSVYRAADSVNDIEYYLRVGGDKIDNWYKRAYIRSFMKKQIIIPKLLYFYSIVRNRLQ